MVRVVSRKGLFVVLRVDRVLGVVDLMQRAANVEAIESNVPVDQIQAVPRKESNAIHKFLKTVTSTAIPKAGDSGPAEAESLRPPIQIIQRSGTSPDARAAQREPLAS